MNSAAASPAAERHGQRMKVGEKELRTAQISDLCRSRLLNYADTFSELAKSYDGRPVESGQDRQKFFYERRLWESRQIIRGHLTEMAHIMTEVAGSVLSYRPMEEKKRKTITQVMRGEGIKIENPCYIQGEDGRESIVVTMSSDKKPGISAEDVTDMLSVLLDRRLELCVTSPCTIEESPHTFMLEDETKYIALTGFARATKENETISGDNYSVVRAEKGKLTVMLSDGTGSGEKAGQESGEVLDMMERMLEAGYHSRAAVQMMNASVFALGEDMNHPTLDLCEINLYQGTCELRKMGGAVTFIKHDSDVEKIVTGSLPLGIFQYQDVITLHRTLRDGDYVIMVSDGVVDAFEQQDYEETLRQVVASIREVNPSEVAEKLLRIALHASGGRVGDDMTVGVVGVWETRIA